MPDQPWNWSLAITVLAWLVPNPLQLLRRVFRAIRAKLKGTKPPPRRDESDDTRS